MAAAVCNDGGDDFDGCVCVCVSVDAARSFGVSKRSCSQTAAA